MYYYTEIARLYNNGDVLWLEHFKKDKADLFCESFLDLKLLQEYFNYSSYFEEVNDLVVRDIFDIYLVLLVYNRLKIELLIILF